MIAVKCQDNEVKTSDGTCTVPRFKASFNSEKLDLTLYKPNPTLQNLPLLPVVDVQVEPGLTVFMRKSSIRNAFMHVTGSAYQLFLTPTLNSSVESSWVAIGETRRFGNLKYRISLKFSTQTCLGL